MQLLKRNITYKEKTETHNTIRIDIIDAKRISLRFPTKNTNKTTQDIIINLTTEETNKLKKIINTLP